MGVDTMADMDMAVDMEDVTTERDLLMLSLDMADTMADMDIAVDMEDVTTERDLLMLSLDMADTMVDMGMNVDMDIVDNLFSVYHQEFSVPKIAENTKEFYSK